MWNEWGGEMLLKTNAKRETIGQVRFIHNFVSLGPVRLNVIVYEVDGILIDTGSIKVIRFLQPFFEEVQAEQVVITHSHEDHTGGAAFIQQKYGIPIYMNEKSIAHCKEKATYPLYRKVFWGKRPPFEAKPIDDTFTSRTAHWQVIDTPGHAADHLSFLNEQTGQLFSGDLYVHPETKVILQEESIPTIIQSIKRVLQYDFKEIFCCHAGYVANGREAFEQKLRYLENLQGKVLTLHEKGSSVKEIQQRIFTKSYPITKLSLGEWDSKHIITSIIQDAKRG